VAELLCYEARALPYFCRRSFGFSGSFVLQGFMAGQQGCRLWYSLSCCATMRNPACHKRVSSRHDFGRAK
jgi:hypothetical protein